LRNNRYVVCGATHSPVPLRPVKAPVAGTPLPQVGEGSKSESTLPSPLWGRGGGDEGILRSDMEQLPHGKA
jgi:hypothetical protein